MQDATGFIDRIRDDSSVRDFLSSMSIGPVVVTRAPGRLDVMGGVADYSGSLVCETTIDAAALVALSVRTDRLIRIWTLRADASLTAVVSLSLVDLFDGDKPRPYDDVGRRLRTDAHSAWAAYVAGCFPVLVAENLASPFKTGANIVLDSCVPLGAGVSSSAAIEVGAMLAIVRGYGLMLDGLSIAKAAQTVENRIVGAPCGIMDQMSSALGVSGGFLVLRCQPHDVVGTPAWPAGVRFFGIDSGVKHSVSGNAYTKARVAAFMGRKLLGAAYLARMDRNHFRRERREVIPSKMTGRDYIQRYGDHGDPITTIDPDTTYSVRAATEHGINENARVAAFVRLLGDTEATQRSLVRAGRLMAASHHSYNRIDLGSPETDRLVAIGRDSAAPPEPSLDGHPAPGIYGAKITGGGSGGTVALLAYGESGEQRVREIAARYTTETGHNTRIFCGGASPGALAFGHEEVQLA